MQNELNISLLLEIKLNETKQQFSFDDYKVLRRGKNTNGERRGVGIIFNINEKMPCKTITVEGPPDDCEISLIEKSIRNQKWEKQKFADVLQIRFS